MNDTTLNQTQTAERVHIGFFGTVNSGKSSLVNRIANQEVSIVSDIEGTTTDPVRKAMELLPIGAVTLFDTAGLDDTTSAGELRQQKTFEILRHTDLAVHVIDITSGESDSDIALRTAFREKGVPFVTVFNKCDLKVSGRELSPNEIEVSALTGEGCEELKSLMCRVYQRSHEGKSIQPLVGDLIERNSVVILVTPIDGSAPQGRLILPQAQTIRSVLDEFAVCITVQPEQLKFILSQLKSPPDLVITDSQVFSQVNDIVPENILLTSFSVLFARYKGVLPQALQGIKALKELKDGDCVLISEGCTHHRKCGDIGRDKIPAWIAEFTGKKLCFEFSSGNFFPEKIGRYSLIVHCGGCMLSAREMQFRRQSAQAAGVPFTNYGVLIAAVKGILERSVSFLR